MASFAPRGPLPAADLRNAMPGDADDVGALLTEMGYPCEPREAIERIAEIFADDRQALVVARCDGKVQGLLALDFMYYLPLGTITCRITALVVTEAAQGRGLGRQLLREAERRARAARAARLEMTSGSQRTDAHAFYKACGYSDGTLRFIKRLGAA